MKPYEIEFRIEGERYNSHEQFEHMPLVPPVGGVVCLSGVRRLIVVAIEYEYHTDKQVLILKCKDVPRET